MAYKRRINAAITSNREQKTIKKGELLALPLIHHNFGMPLPKKGRPTY